jgi:hypothetical protein
VSWQVGRCSARVNGSVRVGGSGLEGIRKGFRISFNLFPTTQKLVYGPKKYLEVLEIFSGGRLDDLGQLLLLALRLYLNGFQIQIQF